MEMSYNWLCIDQQSSHHTSEKVLIDQGAEDIAMNEQISIESVSCDFWVKTKLVSRSSSRNGEISKFRLSASIRITGLFTFNSW